MCLPGGSDIGPPSYTQLSVVGAGAYLCEKEALWPRPGRPSLLWRSLAGHSRRPRGPPVEGMLRVRARMASRGLWKGTQGLTWPLALLGFRVREGRREEKLRLVPALVDTLSLWGCLLSSSWLPGTAWLVGAFHLLAQGSQAV